MSKYFDFVLTEDQLTYLAENENRDLVYKVLETLVIRTCINVDHTYDKNGFAILFGTGQTLISDSELAELCSCDLKTVSKIVMELNDVGLISTLINEQKSIHTLRFIDEIHGAGDLGYTNPYCQKRELLKKEMKYEEQKYADKIDGDDKEGCFDDNAASDLSSSEDDYNPYWKPKNEVGKILYQIVNFDSRKNSKTSDVTANTLPGNAFDTNQEHTEIEENPKNDFHSIRDLYPDNINKMEEK